MNEQKRYLTVKETSTYLGLSRWTIGRMVKDNVIPYTSFGRLKRFDKLRIDEWVAKRTVEGRV